jgi:phosphoribosylamine--glycine ligase
MNVLVIGSGGREHALVWKIKQSPAVRKLYCAPGSAAIGELAECVAIGPEQIDRLGDFAQRERIDLTVVGPELPLTLGIADSFHARGLKLFGPNRVAARLEGSKAFAKQILQENGIPTALSAVFTEPRPAKQYIAERSPPYVIKADGLAGGKGVLISPTLAAAAAAVDEILIGKSFGTAGEKLLVEEFLEGEEVSFMALTDGENILPLASSQDHKRVFDNDRGPNTGGMGAYSPAAVVSPAMHRRILDEILHPLLAGLRKKGIVYQGVLYVGLMITESGPKVLEFNARFGDPECQPLMVRLKSDIVPLFEATIDRKLDQIAPEWYPDAAVCVVLCAAGYPGTYDKGKEIHGLDKLRDWNDGFVFHAGTAQEQGRWVTAGGRVLAVTAKGSTIAAAVDNVYRAVSEISWDGMHYRKDIARRALEKP